MSHIWSDMNLILFFCDFLALTKLCLAWALDLPFSLTYLLPSLLPQIFAMPVLQPFNTSLSHLFWWWLRVSCELHWVSCDLKMGLNFKLSLTFNIYKESTRIVKWGWTSGAKQMSSYFLLCFICNGVELELVGGNLNVKYFFLFF